MKKSALLAVSALSLGVVGLATFTPLAYAATTTQDATITVTVEGQIGIGNEDGTALSDMDVNYTLSANDVKQDQTRTIKTTNNTGNDLTLTVKSKADDASLIGANPGNKIPAGTNIAAGTSAWGIKGGKLSNWTAVPAASAGGLEIGNDASRVDGVETFEITYGVSTNATQPVDTYKDTITYTVSQ